MNFQTRSLHWYSGTCFLKKCLEVLYNVFSGGSIGRGVAFGEGGDPRGTPGKKGREVSRNGLSLFPVSRLRIPKIPEFC